MRRRHLTALVLALPLAGCVSWTGATAGTSLDTKANPGFAGRIEAGGGLGAQSFRVYSSGSFGAGYQERDKTGYGEFGLEFGVEGGADLQYAVAIAEAVRFLPNADITTQFGVGLVGQLLGRVGPAENDHGGTFIGARILPEVQLPFENIDPPPPAHIQWTGSFVFRYVFSDSSGQKSPI